MLFFSPECQKTRAVKFSQSSLTDSFNKQHFSLFCGFFFLTAKQPSVCLLPVFASDRVPAWFMDFFFFLNHRWFLDDISNTVGPESRLSPLPRLLCRPTTTENHHHRWSSQRLRPPPDAAKQGDKKKRPKWQQPEIHRRYDWTRSRDKTWINLVSASVSADGRHSVSSWCLVQLRETKELPEFSAQFAELHMGKETEKKLWTIVSTEMWHYFGTIWCPNIC